MYCIFSLILHFFATNNFFSHLGSVVGCGIVVNTSNIEKRFYTFLNLYKH